MKLLTTGATQLDGPERLLTTRETVLENKRTSLGGATNNRNNSAGGTSKVVYYMRISAGGAREVGNKRRNNARKARDFDNMINSIAGAIDAGNNRRNSIVAMGITFFISLYSGKPNEALDALRYMRFCEQVSCQTVHGQPQDWTGCASRLAPK